MSETIAARTIVVLADCHIHPADGIDWPDAALTAFAGADLIIALGDMGEMAGYEALTGIAPVIGVRGADDVDNPYTDGVTRLLDVDGVRIGCVFDPKAAGVATTTSPLVLAEIAVVERTFGGRVDVLLWASTHVPSVERVGGRLVVNPGSATLPDNGSRAGFARLTIDEGVADAEIVAI